MPALSEHQPPINAWAVTVFFTASAGRPTTRRNHGLRLAAQLLRRTGKARGVAGAHLAMIEAPHGGPIEFVHPEAPPPPGPPGDSDG